MKFTFRSLTATSSIFSLFGFCLVLGIQATKAESACLTEMHVVLATKANGDYPKRLRAREMAQMFLAALEVLKTQSEAGSLSGIPHLEQSTYYRVKFNHRSIPHQGGFLIGPEPATSKAVGFPEWVIKFYPDSGNKELILKIVYKAHDQFSTLTRDQIAKFVERQFMEDELVRLERRARAVGLTVPAALTDVLVHKEKLKRFIETELLQIESDLASDKVRQLVLEKNPAVFAGLRKLSEATDQDLHAPINLHAKENEACKLGGAPFQLFTYF